MQEFFQENKKGIIGTTIFHAVVALIILFLGFSTPVPPPGEEALIINFGTDDDGFGITQAARQQATPPPPSPRPVETTETEEQVITQDFEEAPALPSPQEEEPPQPEPEPPVAEPEPTPVEPEIIEEEVVEEVPERRPNPNAMFPGRTTSGEPGSTEGETTGPGNQGRETGSTASPSRTGGDTGSPDGISYSLAGRNPMELPLPEYNQQVEGVVVVEVHVNKNGKVTRAIAGVRGSTIQNINLLTAAQKAAEEASFDVKLDAPETQKGTITYRFRLQ